MLHLSNRKQRKACVHTRRLTKIVCPNICLEDLLNLFIKKVGIHCLISCFVQSSHYDTQAISDSPARREDAKS